MVPDLDEQFDRALLGHQTSGLGLFRKREEYQTALCKDRWRALFADVDEEGDNPGFENAFASYSDVFVIE